MNWCKLLGHNCEVWVKKIEVRNETGNPYMPEYIERPQRTCQWCKKTQHFNGTIRRLHSLLHGRWVDEEMPDKAVLVRH